MFGVDFSELMVILVVALIVIGPERLPKVARTAGMFWARAQRYINGVKADMAREMAVEEFRALQQKVQQEATAAQQVMQQTTNALDQQTRELHDAVIQSPAATQPALPTAEQKKFPTD
jgi:sec-independent protein translocase protein TatB